MSTSIMSLISGLIMTMVISTIGYAATRESWTVIICKPSTEATSVNVYIDGTGKSYNEHKKTRELWVTWHASNSGDWAEYDVAPKWKNHGKIWVQGVGHQDDINVHMAVTDRGNTKRIFSFDSYPDGEHADISKLDGNKAFKCPK